MMPALSARGWISLLYHGDKAIDTLGAALELGLLERLDAGPVSLAALSERLEAVPGRLYKLLDCLESLGLVERFDADDGLLAGTRYRSLEPLHEAALAVLGPASIERGRDSHDGWRQIHKRLAEVIRGRHAIDEVAFSWPPRTPEQIASFEKSMALGCVPIAESFIAGAKTLWQGRDGQATEAGAKPIRLLDVGGGDGTLARLMAEAHPWLHVDVYNLPATRLLVERQRAESAARDRLGFVAGDFFAEALPSGYDALSFVRVLHDWPAEIARQLLAKAFAALAPGGRLFICEELRTSDRLAIQFFWSYFLIGVDSCVSRLRDAETYLRTLEQLGFTGTRVVSGPFDVIVSVRP